MASRPLNYWEKPERQAGFTVPETWQVCYAPDYLDRYGLYTWWSQVNALVEQGVLASVRWYHRLYSWFWYD